MKKYTLMVLSAVMTLCLAACDGLLSPKDILSGDSDASTSGFTVDIQKITFASSEIATLAGVDPELPALIYPSFATRNELEWSSSKEDVATVDSGGSIHIVPATVSAPVSSVIKVWSAFDPSIYAECMVTVYPAYPNNRTWTFSSRPAGYGNDTLSGNISVTGGPDPTDNLGMTILTKTGNAVEYIDGNKGAGEYVIDSADPYQFGITPDGGARGSVAFNSGAAPSGSGFSSGQIRSGGNSRIMKIAALQGPFTITVNYLSNGTAGVHPDIRIGDTSGIRIEGEGSPGTNAADVRTVQYAYQKNDFVPLVYIETKGNIRIFDIKIIDRVVYPYTPVPDFTISGDAGIVAGQTKTYNTNISQTLTSPVYKWEITAGGDKAQIAGSDNGPSVQISGTAAGSVTLKAAITTTDPNNNTPTTKNATMNIAVTQYIPVTGVSISGSSTVAESGTVLLTAVPTPSNASNPAYTWSVSGDGELTDGQGTETATFKGKTAGGSFTATVKAVTTHPVTNVATQVTSTGHIVNVTAAVTVRDWKFGDDVFKTGLAATFTDTRTVDGLTFVGGSGLAYNTSNQTLSGTTYSSRLQLNGAGSTSSRNVNFPVTGPCKVTVIAHSGNSGRALVLYNGTSEVGRVDVNAIASVNYTYTGGAGILYLYSSSGGINLYTIKVENTN